MQVLLVCSRCIDAINAWIGRCVSWLVLAVVLISAGNAVSRKLFALSSNGFLEVQWYLFSAIFMLAAAYTLQQNAHIRIDVITGRLSHKTQAVVDIVCTLLFLFPVSFFMIKFGWPMFMTAWTTHEMSNNPGGLVRWPVYLLIPVGFTLLAAQGFSEIIKRLAFLTGQGPDPVSRATPEKSAGSLT